MTIQCSDKWVLACSGFCHVGVEFDQAKKICRDHFASTKQSSQFLTRDAMIVHAVYVVVVFLCVYHNLVSYQNG